MSDMQQSILNEVYDERRRQEQLRNDGKFDFTCADKDCTSQQKLPILGEEFGEVCRAVCEQDGNSEIGRTNLRKELIEVAAVAVAWVESLS